MATAKKTPAKSDDPFGEFEFVSELNSSFVKGPVSSRGPRESPEEKARRVMVTALQEQINYWRDPEYKRQVTRYIKGQGKTISQEAPKPIWVEDDEGTYYVTPRYGVRPFPIKEGMPTAKLVKEQVEAFLIKLQELVKEGHYDAQLTALSKR